MSYRRPTQALYDAQDAAAEAALASHPDGLTLAEWRETIPLAKRATAMDSVTHRLVFRRSVEYVAASKRYRLCKSPHLDSVRAVLSDQPATVAQLVGLAGLPQDDIRQALSELERGGEASRVGKYYRRKAAA
jgi:predicted Rossmann fold nucleotide-binding protein DprA/Smf involved in DNA uptake